VNGVGSPIGRPYAFLKEVGNDVAAEEVDHVVLGVLTAFFVISGATGTWWPVVICGIAFLIGIASLLQHRRASGRAMP
jgi:hypothetical protein